MSEPVTTWQPLNDFDEAGRQMREPARQNGVEGRAERYRLIGGREERAVAREAPAGDSAPVADLRAQECLFKGDFAEIEAALLQTALLSVTPSEPIESRETRQRAHLDLRAWREEPDQPAGIACAALSVEAPDAADRPAPPLSADRDGAFHPDAGAPSNGFILFDDAAVSGSAAMAEEDKRSRRPLYIMAALVLAGVAGMAATSFRRDGAAEMAQVPLTTAAIAPIAAENGASPAPQGGNSVETPAPQASAALTTPQGADTASNEQPVNPAPAPDSAARVVSFSEPAASAVAPAALPGASEPAIGGSSILAPPPVAKTPALGSIGEAKKVKTAAVRPDGSLIKAAPPAKATPPKAALNKDIPAKTSPVKVATAKAAPKVAASTVTPPAAAKTASAATKPAHGATAAKAKAPPAQDAQLAPAAPAAEAQPAAPAPKPAGPLAFVDTAVSSITGATGKLLNWGGAAHN